MNLEQINNVLKFVRYKSWDIYTDPDDKFAHLYVSFTSDGEVLKGRKWMLSPHMTKSEVVQTAFLAVKTAEEHEMREKFTYCGRPIFGPHQDVDTLWQNCDKTDERKS